MRERWLILAVLTFARTVMGFQYQSVAAVSPLLVDQFQLSYAALGTLIGLYLLPGIAVALPGGMLGQRVGDKRAVLFGLAAMAGGGALMGAASDATTLMLGRVLSGAGAVILNVLFTKMVTDWFAGRELVTALGILITSWPLGIALALVALPGLADALSWPAAMYLPAAISAIALGLVAACDSAAPGSRADDVAGFGFDLTRRELMLAAVAGLVWTFYNVGFIVLLAFGPAFLVASGYSAQAASAILSAVSLISIPAVAMGSWVAGRIGRADATMAVCFLLLAAAICSIAGLAPSLALFAAIGVIFGPPAGLIMALPGEAARPERRAVAMGVYYTGYYAGMGVLPALAGFARDAAESAAAPLWFSGAMMVLAGLLLVQFRQLQARPGRHAAA